MRIYKPRKLQTRRKRLQKGSGKVQIAYHDLPAYKIPTEDRISLPFVSENLIVLGLFDGHGGANISELLHNELPKRIKNAIKFSQDTGTIIQIINAEFDKLDAEIGTSVGGSTATIVVVTKTDIIVANVGDSPAILFKKDGTLLYNTDDHDCSNMAEHDRISNAGGTCVLLNGIPRLESGLAVTRAFGDYAHDKRIVISTAQIYVWPRQKDTYLCMCSDSFTEDYYEFQEAGQHYRTIANIKSAADVVKEIAIVLKNNNYDIEKSVKKAVENRVALFKGHGDNTSLLLAYFP
jgi:serine/threonine protein phosphatase PrpC